MKLLLFAVLLLTGWLWDRPMVDCLGMPETDLSHYWLMATVRQNLYVSCLDDQGLPSLCLTVLPGPPIRFLKTPDPGYGLTAGTSLDPTSDPNPLPLPPIDGVTAWPWISPENPYMVIAVDGAGNESRACP